MHPSGTERVPPARLAVENSDHTRGQCVKPDKRTWTQARTTSGCPPPTLASHDGRPNPFVIDIFIIVALLMSVAEGRAQNPNPPSSKAEAGSDSATGGGGEAAAAAPAFLHVSAAPRVRTQTCDAFAMRWLDDYPRPAASSRRSYGYAVQAFAKDFAGVKLSDLDRPTARAWAIRQPKGNVSVVRAMLGDAVRDGLVQENVFAGLRIERSRGRRDLVALTEAEVRELADVATAIHGPTFSAMVVFAAYTGLRPGELFALEHGDIDDDEVHVRRSRDSTGELKLPKSGHTRTVILPPPARDALLAMPRRLDVPWVFTTATGRPFTKSSLHYHWTPVRAAFGRPTMHFYELRHACATMLLERGLSHADVAQQLGHSDGGALILSTYGHPSEQASRGRVKAAFSAQVAGLRVANRSQPDSDSA